MVRFEYTCTVAALETIKFIPSTNDPPVMFVPPTTNRWPTVKSEFVPLTNTASFVNTPGVPPPGISSPIVMLVATETTPPLVIARVLLVPE